MDRSGLNTYNLLEIKYDAIVVSIFRSCQKANSKISRLQLHLEFNLSCKRLRLIPRSLHVKELVNSIQGKLIAVQSSRKFLRARIALNHLQLRKSRFELSKGCQTLSAKLDPVDFIAAISSLRLESQRIKDKLGSIHATKLQRLISLQKTSLNPSHNHPSSSYTSNNQKWSINLSSRQLTETETSVLNLGLKFAVSPKKINFCSILSCIDPHLSDLHVELQHDIRKSIVSILRKNCRRSHQNISSDQQLALSHLKDYHDIIITRADKSPIVVIMDKVVYTKKLEELLKDKSIYTLLNGDPTSKFQRKLNKTITELEKKGSLDTSTAKYLRNYTARAPVFFGYPKIHKSLVIEELPMRPIVDFHTSPVYNLSKFLVKLLRPLISDSLHTVKNGADFLSAINELTITENLENYVLASFDVVSLFTCIPVQLVRSTVESKLNSDFSLLNTNLKKEDVMKILDLCLSSTYLSFNNLFYEQYQGTPMGSPVSPILAELVMQHIEQEIIEQCGEMLLIWKRYVDDVFVVVERSKLSDVTAIANSINNHIQFTVEIENDKYLHFLDVLIKRSDTNFQTSVYRKPENFGQYIKPSSNHPISHKKSTIVSLINRAKIYCSDDSLLKLEIDTIVNQMKLNGFKENYTKRIIQEYLDRPQMTTVIDPHQNISKPKRISFPYYYRTSEEIAKLLRLHDFKISFKPINTIRSQLSRVKPKVPALLETDLVYAIPCKQCDAIYYGQSKRHLETRMKEHSHSLEVLDDKSKLVEHCIISDHVPDLKQVKITNHNIRNKASRLFVESWNTYFDFNSINNAKQLPHEYAILQ